jgi:hypothetical protein
MEKRRRSAVNELRSLATSDARTSVPAAVLIVVVSYNKQFVGCNKTLAGYNLRVAVAKTGVTNPEVAALLDEVGDILEAQGAQPYRALAYHRAAATVRELPSAVSDLVESGGEAALESLAGIGENLARRILEILDTGRLQLLERLRRLRGEAEPEALFRTVPGIGPRLASEIHERLGIESLEELEMAAHDSRLSTVPGFGSRRLRAVEESLRAVPDKTASRGSPVRPWRSFSTSIGSTGRRPRKAL